MTLVRENNTVISLITPHSCKYKTRQTHTHGKSTERALRRLRCNLLNNNKKTRWIFYYLLTFLKRKKFFTKYSEISFGKAKTAFAGANTFHRGALNCIFSTVKNITRKCSYDATRHNKLFLTNKNTHIFYSKNTISTTFLLKY